MGRPTRGPVWAAELWLRQRRIRWRTRRERQEERRARRVTDDRADRKPRWQDRSWLRTGVLVLAGLLIVWLLYSLALAVWQDEPARFRPSRWCSRNTPGGYYCSQVFDFVKGPLGLALTVAVFLLGRYLWVSRWYRRQARDDRRVSIPTAEHDVRNILVVGRDELCGLLVRRLCDPTNRRPLLLVGGIGTGKTTTLVRLAEKLMNTRVVPIGIQLRDVTSPGEFDFRALARRRFQDSIDTQLHSDGEADKIWRQLWRENRIVVLADGLEEALADTAQPCDRDSVLREAVRKARRDRLPLVIASRPDDPLRGLEAIMLQVEPLSEGAALEYVQVQSRRTDTAHRWDQIISLVKGADVADSPFYLRVIGQLYEVNRLDRVAADAGRAAVRRSLLDEWYDALVDGDLYEDYGLPATERRDALEVLSALACIGLRNNRLVVKTHELAGTRDTPDAGRRRILAVLREHLTKLSADNPQDLGLAATTGGALNIVSKQRDGVRFQHGVVQAYLGSRFLAAALRDPGFLDHAFRCGNGPGRELLAALTLHCSGRRAAGTGRRRDHPARPSLADRFRTRRPGQPQELLRRLRTEAVRTHNRTRALEIFAAALEMDAATGHTCHRSLAEAVSRAWSRYQGDGSVTDRPLEDAKIALIHRFGDAARRVGPRAPHPPQYRLLFDMMATETSYLARLNAARELGGGGDATVHALRDLLGGPSDAGPAGDERQRGRLRQVLAWTAPALFLFAEEEHQLFVDGVRRPGTSVTRDAGSNLRRWVDHLGSTRKAEARTWELDLAQGFRLAANCRAYPRHRSYLVEEAELALRHSHFWYSHLVLIQALTLLALPRDPAENLRARGHGSDPRGLVTYWLSIAGSGTDAPTPDSESPHPLVREVADQCVAALIDRHPERHCWMDEHEIVGRVGSVSPQPEIRGLEDSWLPASHGWAVLEPRAQRLLADVMLLLNLAYQGRDDAERARRLTRSSRRDLPPCLTIDRGAMRVNLSRRQAHDVQPGSTCIDDCPFRLCPLPPRGDELPYQMDEAFCAHQADLVGRWYQFSLRAGWQFVDRDDLRAFWQDMSERMLPAWRK
ncbi:hypothetical protein AWW66_17865 [Micromonospora rosaria]|uniref:NACHT domain-containing protein n=1 Tax=Micromonospora rosaria TaxID=47874 RepID=A0A136PQY3_9ACTN|nr:NACHT domain-containing protein [Micromonospora rosaria]KXK60626.1 hypothetical protein AWW66_17865 [Micromonospora rosaria]